MTEDISLRVVEALAKEPLGTRLDVSILAGILEVPYESLHDKLSHDSRLVVRPSLLTMHPQTLSSASSSLIDPSHHPHHHPHHHGRLKVHLQSDENKLLDDWCAQVASHLLTTPGSQLESHRLNLLPLFNSISRLGLNPLDTLKQSAASHGIIVDANQTVTLAHTGSALDALEQLMDEFTDAAADYLHTLGRGAYLSEVERAVIRPASLPCTIETIYLLESDIHDRFVITKEIVNGEEMLMANLKTVEDSLADWRDLVFSFMQPHRLTAVPLSLIGASVPKPEYVPRSVKLTSVLRDDPQRRFSLLRDHRQTVRVALQSTRASHHIPHIRNDCVSESSPDFPLPTCSVCLVNARATLLLPCRHLGTCSSCADKLTVCPACRAIIDSKIDVYL